MSRYDVIVIGAGHNGLTAAALLAQAGKRVVVVERRDVLGGMCAGEEFHPGFRTSGLLHDTASVRRDVATRLRLREFGCPFAKGPADVFIPQENGPGLLLADNAEAAGAEIAAHSKDDAEAYKKYRAFIEKVRRVVEPMANDFPPDLTGPGAGDMMGLVKKGLSLRMMGADVMMDLLRIPPMCVADWLREYFETELLNAALAHNAIAGTWTGPWSPGTAGHLLLWECTSSASLIGGAAELVFALERAAKHAGVEIRTDAAAERIVVKSGKVTGVTVGGETREAENVLATCDPRTTFLDLLEPGALSHRLERQISAFRTRGTTAKVHLAIEGKLQFACRPRHEVTRARTGETLDDQERAFDAVKYRRFSERPVLDIYVPTVTRPENAPAGHNVVSILVHFAAFDLDGGWTDDSRERLGEVVIDELSRYAPEVRKQILAREVLTPADIAERYGTTGGHIHHGEHAIDQLLARPTMDTARYVTPIEGLFLGGSGSFPGGGVTCAPGSLAARAVLDL